MLAHYSAALDEIWRLRVALAYELAALGAALDYQTLPTGVRQRLERVRDRIQRAGRGEDVHATGRLADKQTLLLDAGIPITLTRHQWENRKTITPAS